MVAPITTGEATPQELELIKRTALAMSKAVLGEATEVLDSPRMFYASLAVLCAALTESNTDRLPPDFDTEAAFVAQYQAAVFAWRQGQQELADERRKAMN